MSLGLPPLACGFSWISRPVAADLSVSCSSPGAFIAQARYPNGTLDMTVGLMASVLEGSPLDIRVTGLIGNNVIGQWRRDGGVMLASMLLLLLLLLVVLLLLLLLLLL